MLSSFRGCLGCPFPAISALQVDAPTAGQEHKCRTPAKIAALGLRDLPALLWATLLQARNAFEPISTGKDIEFRTRLE